MVLFFRGPAGYDRTRNAIIGNKDFELTYLEEAYTTEHWLVRIYRVKKPYEFNRPSLKLSERILTPTNYITKKVLLYFENKYSIFNTLNTFRILNVVKDT